MCLNCWHDAGRPFNASDRARAAAPLFASADPFSSLHIIVDDWNLDDDHLEFCTANQPNETERDLLSRLKQMSVAERWATAILADFPNFDPEKQDSF